MKEILEFNFPKVIRDTNGHGKKCVKAILEGPEKVKELYGSMKKSKHLAWYEHRFIFFQTFFNKGCIFRIKDQNKDIDSNIFNLLDINVKNMINHPGDSQETQAVKTSREVVNSFIKGEECLNKSHSIAENNKSCNKEKRKGDLAKRMDSVEWLEQYYYVIQIMFENGMSIMIPDENNDITKDIKKIENNEMTIAELKQKKRQEMK